jgi:hypothetical protein
VQAAQPRASPLPGPSGDEQETGGRAQAAKCGGVLLPENSSVCRAAPRNCFYPFHMDSALVDKVLDLPPKAFLELVTTRLQKHPDEVEAIQRLVRVFVHEEDGMLKSTGFHEFIHFFSLNYLFFFF